jgi:hypothetical protein
MCSTQLVVNAGLQQRCELMVLAAMRNRECLNAFDTAAADGTLVDSTVYGGYVPIVRAVIAVDLGERTPGW